MTIAPEIRPDSALEKYVFPWGILNILLSQQSPIDLTRLAMADHQDAYHFVLNYGYDLTQTEGRTEIERIQQESCRFIQQYFLDTLAESKRSRLVIPTAIQQSSVLELLLLASKPNSSSLQKWACALLRVMHTVAHLTSDLSASFFPLIQRQILENYHKHILVIDDGSTFLGHDPATRLQLVAFHVKERKDRDSTVLKLLHKPENVAADIFDRIGVRFVTKDKLDALLVVKYLRENNIVIFPNVKPSRSVNTLIDTEKFKRSVTKLFDKYESGEISFDEFEQCLRFDAQFEDTLSRRQIQGLLRRNPYSGGDYRAIQFTVRQLIRIPNLLYVYRDMIDLNQAHQLDFGSQLYTIQPHYKFFFPYEVQVVDVATHRNNIEGHASYDVYKLKQLNSARQRILRGLLKEPIN